MATNGDNSSTAAISLQEPQFANDSDARLSSDGKDGVDLAASTLGGTNGDINSAASADLGSSSTSDYLGNGTHANNITHNAPEGHSNTQANENIDNDASEPSTDTMAKANVPDIEINGKPEEDFVNNNLMGPEDEDDGETHPLLERETADVGEKKKKKKKPKSKRGLTAPTGFEEYYVDAPLTPAEHEEERGIYDISVPFRERIEIAIQRYFAKRNLNSERKDVFDKYMSFGGVDAGQKMFSGGLDAKTLSDRTAPEIATLTAKHSVGDDKDDRSDSAFVVDFEGIVKAFLSSQLPLTYDLWNEESIKFRVTIVRNFLNYLLHHDVCPEFNEQVYAAREICHKADKELWMIVQAGRLLPGSFNTACSEIFGGCLRGLYIGDQEWAQGAFSNQAGISPQMAHKTFKIGLIARASEESIKLFAKQDDANKIKIMNETETGLEITELIPAEEEVLELYQSEHGEGLKPLGRLKAKTWYFPGAPDEDLTEEEEAAAKSATKETKEYELWVEDDVLQKCFIGMKFVTVVKELSFGIHYFDILLGTYCSFYNVLPNEEILGWREPEKTWLPMRENFDFDGGNEDGGDENTGEDSTTANATAGGLRASDGINGHPNGNTV